MRKHQNSKTCVETARLSGNTVRIHGSDRVSHRQIGFSLMTCLRRESQHGSRLSFSRNFPTDADSLLHCNMTGRKISYDSKCLRIPLTQSSYPPFLGTHAADRCTSVNERHTRPCLALGDGSNGHVLEEKLQRAKYGRESEGKRKIKQQLFNEQQTTSNVSIVHSMQLF